ncbi:MAG: ABC transporter permease [Burkholderiales bacterium]|nr:ABC transporter permease [Phycisphaerae bacterium]
MSQIAASPLKRPHLSIRAGSGFVGLNIAELWQFRDLLGGLARRDVRLRYRQTALGVLWVIIQPLIAAGVMTFVFGTVAKLPSEGVPYFAYAFASLLGWNLFASTLTKAGSCLTGNANLVSKVYFPRLILPLSIVPSSLIDFAVASSIMVFLMFKAGIQPTWAMLLLPVWLSLLLMFALGIGLYASALMVSYRDVQFILPVMIQLLFYGSPVVYSLTQVPDWALSVYMLNPLAELMRDLRWSILGTTTPPDIRWVAYSAAICIGVFVLGAVTFKRMERRFADVI